jgi:hypothetical protein
LATVNGIKELAKYVNQISKQAMNNGSATKNLAIKTGERHVQTDVYEKYTPDESNPKAYKRTGKLKESWETEPTSDGMAVFNTRKDDGRYVAEVVETGVGYKYDFEYNGVPRPFTKNAANELRNNGELADALKKDMRAMGMDVQ